MTWTIAKIAAAGALAAMPLAAVDIPAYAAENSSDAPIVLPVRCRPTRQPTRRRSPRRHGEYYNPNDYNDWNSWYNTGADWWRRGAAAAKSRTDQPGGRQRVVAADDVGSAVQAEVLQRGRGQARGVALRAQHDPLDVVADRLRQTGIAGGIAAPLQHISLDDERVQLFRHLTFVRSAGPVAGCRPAPRRGAARRAPRRQPCGAGGSAPTPGRDRYGSSLLRFVGQFSSLAAQPMLIGHLVIRHRGQRRRVGVHAQ